MTVPDRSPRTLVLWDVDHTLIETRGVGRAIYDRAFPAATGQPLRKLAKIAGRTELDIMAESLRINDIEPTTDAVARLADALVQEYEDARDELRTTGRALPGAEETLARLAGDSAIYQAVLSGNLRAVARIKLEVFGLDKYLDLEASAFGDDHADRPKLVAIAQQRAERRTGTRFEGPGTVIVGDTPNDVKAALTAGVDVIAVATGKSTEDDLRAAGAERVIASLHTFPVL
ncbi:haloacid dehalogenase-like hydrolase [Amycolatopsis sp. CA-161197]|uniref:haloacid dehalogenase-like hydrolase n=1 Tax=Amycolatopsis sp. CA-161197 TaxID=3239922 RepID=UPI003D910F30